MLKFVPLHLTALDRSKNLKKWIIDWMTPSLEEKESIEFLDESGWFWRGHDLSSGHINADGIWIPHFKSGIFIWTPAPAAAQFAVEQLREARNKRTDSLHVVVIPRLFTSIWRRQLSRVADVFVYLPFLTDI